MDAKRIIAGFFDVPENKGRIYQKAIQPLEKELIISALAHTKGNQTQAAKWLGISRATFHQRVKYYKITKIYKWQYPPITTPEQALDTFLPVATPL